MLNNIQEGLCTYELCYKVDCKSPVTPVLTKTF